MASTTTTELYYFSTSRPSGLDIPNSSTNELGATVLSIDPTSTPNIWKILYRIPDPLTFTCLNGLLGMYLKNTNQLAELLKIKNPDYYQMNIDELSSLKYQFCFFPETNPSRYCPFIQKFSSASPTVKCSRVLSTNPQINNMFNSRNYVQCANLDTSLIDRTNDHYASMSAAFKWYCDKNPDAYDCQCYNRNLDTLYRQAKSALGSAAVNDVCWYRPCAYQTNIYVPPELLNSNATCPSVCANVIIASEVKGKLTMDNVSMNNECFQAAKVDEVSPPSTSPPPTKKENNVVTTPFPSTTILPSPTTTNQPNKKQMIIIISSVIGGIIICIVVWYIFFRKKPSLQTNTKAS